MIAQKKCNRIIIHGYFCSYWCVSRNATVNNKWSEKTFHWNLFELQVKRLDDNLFNIRILAVSFAPSPITSTLSIPPCPRLALGGWPLGNASCFWWCLATEEQGAGRLQARTVVSYENLGHFIRDHRFCEVKWPKFSQLATNQAEWVSPTLEVSWFPVQLSAPFKVLHHSRCYWLVKGREKSSMEITLQCKFYV